MENIQKHDNNLSTILMQKMKEIPYVKILGNENPEKHCGIITFTIDGVHPHDIASILDTEKICIRAGHHCAQPLGEFLNIPASARASLYFYNDEEEIEKFVKALSQVRKWAGFKE